ncbi:hypothetical protein BDN72DRAFT_619749 [Pluteus cervinus]|uniref:Uncharacterized protein n=1 Tax=Pluteus cervinus TaxID=181527 RepID=A0ACD3ATN5_9AGAR|nr:hypothetical protein BDN72DRAFT_619749 [Pluteus cervinus]
MQSIQGDQEPSLPAEVWGKILQFSCTDNGYTGQSLSLTCKTFNALSAPYKLQSISLQSIHYTLAFLQVLRNTPPNLRRIRYLFVSYDGLFRSAYGKQSNWENESCYESDSDTEDSPPTIWDFLPELIAIKARGESFFRRVKGEAEYFPSRDEGIWSEEGDEEEFESLSEEELTELEEDKKPSNSLKWNYL